MVTWSGRRHQKLFTVNIKMVVSNERGVLAKIAAVIAETDSNIDKRQPRTRRFQRLHHHPLHSASVQPTASGADHARPAACSEVIRIWRLKG